MAPWLHMTSTDVETLLARGRARRRLPEPVMRRLLRERANVTQAELAEALGVARSTVSRWEAGLRGPRGAHADGYSELLDRLAAER
jgi:DNA-binding transcriptional regulator YiaG